MACTSYLEHKAAIQEGVMKFMPYFKKSGKCGNSPKHNTRSITQMMQMDWKVMVSSGNRKHVSRSMTIEAKDIIMKERTWINRVAQREHQRGVTNVKRSGGWLNMELKESVWCGSHVKRVMTRFDPAV